MEKKWVFRSRDLDLEVKVTKTLSDIAWTKVPRLTKFGEDPLSGFLGIEHITNIPTNPQTNKQMKACAQHNSHLSKIVNKMYKN